MSQDYCIFVQQSSSQDNFLNNNKSLGLPIAQVAGSDYFIRRRDNEDGKNIGTGFPARATFWVLQ